MNPLDFIFRPSPRIENELTVSRMEALRKAISRAQPPDTVIGGNIKISESGWTLEIPKSSGGSTTIQPHEVISVSEERININNGTVNGLLATPLFELDYTPSDDYQFLICDINVVVNSGPSEATYRVVSEAPEVPPWSENEIPGNIQVLIAVLRGTRIYQIRTGNFSVQVNKVYEKPKEVVAAGEYPFEVYWTLEVEQDG
jgi:hypothetical protein|tara:strand:- start:52 stop:651 length:600 start_codon:yes stop_codon:yes gene_type:complete